MRVLGIEAATSVLSVAVMEDQQLLGTALSSEGGTRRGQLLPLIDGVLRMAALTPQDLDMIAVSIGPGSFTGVRVGLATAQGFVLGTNALLVGVSTLETLAGGYSVIDAKICALLHAGRGEVYSAVFDKRSTGLRRMSPDQVLVPEAVPAMVSTYTTGEVHVIGDGAARHRETLEASFKGRARFTTEGLQAVPTAGIVARLALQQTSSATGGERAGIEVLPIYLRRADAEVNWEKGLIRKPQEKGIRSKVIR